MCSSDLVSTAPGLGKVRFNNTNYSAVTTVAFDNSEFGGTNVSNTLNYFDDSTSSDKTLLFFRSSENQNEFVVYKVTGAANTSVTNTTIYTVAYQSGVTTGFTSLENLIIEPFVVGNKGEVGSKGEVGATGATGDKGQKGTTGDTGSKGDKGEVGSKGDKGEVGVTGDKGQKGDTGSTGAIGSDAGLSYYYSNASTTESASYPASQGFILNSLTPSLATILTVRNVDTYSANNSALFTGLGNYEIGRAHV